eukprot:jgi/Hompol1/7005/HPOL_003815-RA
MDRFTKVVVESNHDLKPIYGGKGEALYLLSNPKNRIAKMKQLIDGEKYNVFSRYGKFLGAAMIEMPTDIFGAEGKIVSLNALERCGFLVLLGADNGLALVLGSLAVQLKELAKIKLGGLENLDLADIAVLERVDALALLLNLLANDLGCKLAHKLSEIAVGSLLGDDVKGLLADLADLSAGGIGGLAELVLSTLGEGNGEHTEEVAVGGLDVNVRLNERLPLLDERAELVRSHLHAVEVGEAGVARNFLDLELDLAETVIHVLGEIGKVDLENTVLEVVLGVLETLGAVDERLANVAGLEERGSLDVVPVLAGEGPSSQ